MTNPELWKAQLHPDSALVGLIYKFCLPPLPRQYVAIDAGCSSGRHLRLLSGLGFKTLGIEKDEESAKKASEISILNPMIAVKHSSLEEFELNSKLKTELFWLTVAWGIMPLDDISKDFITKFKSRFIIADWRTLNNSIFNEEGKTPKFKEFPNGMIYRYHTLGECNYEGYERIFFQTLTIKRGKEINEWYQTVHRKIE